MGVYPLYHNNFDIRRSGWCLGIRLRGLETLDLGTCRHQIEVINEDYPFLCKTDIGSYFRGHWQCGNIPYGVILPRDQVQDMAVRPFAYARIINISIG